MKRFIEGESRSQSTMFPEYLEDYVAEDNPVRVIDVFVDELDLAKLGFDDVLPEITGRPAYHPSTLLKIISTVISTVSNLGRQRALERLKWPLVTRVLGLPLHPAPVERGLLARS